MDRDFGEGMMGQQNNFEQVHYSSGDTRTEVIGSSNQRFFQDPSSSINTDIRPPDFTVPVGARPVMNYSIQTGEEFALEFMRERVNPRQATHSSCFWGDCWYNILYGPEGQTWNISYSDLDDSWLVRRNIEGDSEMQYVIAVNSMDFGSRRNSIALASTSEKNLDDFLSATIAGENGQVAKHVAGADTSDPVIGIPLTSQSVQRW
ncbi:hypothetical protein HAX54_017765 [Datura stramonium]|uniref:Uncharacterized protein n=1 Tax=Datura stramonium TaxID=4076 RepID=A0ABS8ULE2_DATST|nr:hypothetical protein [Datura stramonium]